MKHTEKPNNIVDLREVKKKKIERRLEEGLRKELLSDSGEEDKSGDFTEKNNPEIPADLTVHLDSENKKIEVRGSFQGIRYTDGRQRLENKIKSKGYLLKNSHDFLKEWGVEVIDEPTSDSDIENLHELEDYEGGE